MSWMPLVVSEGCWIVLKVYWMSMNVTESFWRLLEGILNQRPLLCSIITGGCWKLQVVLGRLEDHFIIFHIWCKKPRKSWYPSWCFRTVSSLKFPKMEKIGVPEYFFTNCPPLNRSSSSWSVRGSSATGRSSSKTFPKQREARLGGEEGKFRIVAEVIFAQKFQNSSKYCSL